VTLVASRTAVAALVFLFASAHAGVNALRESPAPMAMWVWAPSDLLDAPDAQRALFNFARKRGIGTLWVQLTTGREREADPATPLTITRAAAWRTLLAGAHAERLRVEALDGDPVYAARAFHHIPFQIAEAVFRFNRDAPPASRFDGLHFDNEPYLLPEWHDRAARERLLREYLDLNVEVQRRVRAHGSMIFGVDIPFWWHHLDDRTGEATAAVTYDGKRQSAALHALERLDSVAVMDYRNFAAGADGIVALARGLLEAADRIDGAEVRVGVETARLAPGRVWFAVGPPNATARPTLTESWRPAPGAQAPLRVFDDGVRFNPGVTIPLDTVAAAPPPALVALAVRHGIRRSAPGGASAEAHAVARLEADPEWSAARPAPIVDPATGVAYHGAIATYTPAAKITFANRPAALARELASAEEAFMRYRRFRGMAIHHYEAFREFPRDGGQP
jgi:hypothetical protein